LELFFPACRQAIKQVTSLFEFVWPTAAALWNLRWQVQGFIAEVPHASVDQLKHRFLFGSKINNVDLKQTVKDYSWDDQTAIFGSFMLTNAFAIYEQWADEILRSLGERAGSGKKLQFPDRLVTAMSTLLASESTLLRSAYYPIFATNKKYSLPQLGNLMLCYRYFKELRNAQVHSGGIANQTAVDAFRAFQPVSSRAQLGRKGELEFDPVVLGQRVSLNLRGVVGFTDILIKIIATIDAELCRSTKAEQVFEKALRASGHRAMLSVNVRKRNAQVSKRCTAAAFPPPRDAEKVYDFLLTKRLIVF
jgi:hypothetical protein